ncbi:MAG: hypothetical protein ACYDCD_02615 [Candidatus Acidiferrales bacterium]
MQERLRGKNGKPYSCSISRHIASAQLFGVYETLCRFAKAAIIENENRAYKLDHPEDQDADDRPVCNARISTLCDVLQVCPNTIRRALRKLLERGFIVDCSNPKPNEKQARKSTGQFAVNAYEIVSHDEYARTHLCPPNFFDKNKNSKVAREDLERMYEKGRRLLAAKEKVRVQEVESGRVQRFEYGRVRGVECGPCSRS